MAGLSLDKVQQKAPGLVSLAKEAKSGLDRRGLGNVPAKVCLVLDYSGSMRNRYYTGEVQSLAERALALGTQLDDDGAIDVFIFESQAHYVGELTLDNYRGGIDRLVQGYRMGTTDYAGAFRQVQEHFFPGTTGTSAAPVRKGLFGRKSAPAAGGSTPADLPVFAIFETDGAPDSRTDAVNALTDASNYPIFWKFLSVGSEHMAFLQKLDDLKTRRIDNADYKPVGDLNRWSDQELFDALLDEYPGYLAEAKRVGILA